MGSQGHSGRLSCSGPATQPEGQDAATQHPQLAVAQAEAWKAERASCPQLQREGNTQLWSGSVMHCVLFACAEVSCLSPPFLVPLLTLGMGVDSQPGPSGDIGNTFLPLLVT